MRIETKFGPVEVQGYAKDFYSFETADGVDHNIVNRVPMRLSVSIATPEAAEANGVQMYYFNDARTLGATYVHLMRSDWKDPSHEAKRTVVRELTAWLESYLATDEGKTFAHEATINGLKNARDRADRALRTAEDAYNAARKAFRIADAALRDAEGKAV